MDARLTWLLDDRPEESGVTDLRQAIEAIGDEHRTISRQEARVGTEGGTLPLESVPTLAYGSIEFAKAIRADFYPGKWCDWTALRCEQYYSRVGEHLLNEDYILLPAGEVRRRRVALVELWNPLFLRPTRADKSFPGFAVTRDDVDRIEQQLLSIDERDLVVLAGGKLIEAEYRTVAVRAKGVVAVSQYMQGGDLNLQPDIPPKARELAEAVVIALGPDFPDPMYVVDVALSGEKYRLLEINSFSASIFYACDIEAIVRAAHVEALREWIEIQP